jgi:hypothetical protein
VLNVGYPASNPWALNGGRAPRQVTRTYVPELPVGFTSGCCSDQQAFHENGAAPHPLTPFTPYHSFHLSTFRPSMRTVQHFTFTPSRLSIFTP